LMKALKANGSDSWPGQPARVPIVWGADDSLPDTDKAQPTAAQPTLDDLMGDYLRELTKLRAMDKHLGSGVPPTRPSGPAVRDVSASTAEMRDLLDALDDLPALN